MRRADRLFQIVQILRRDRLSTARRLGEALGVSERTIYRDISALMASGVAIEGEAGTGYRMGRHAELPALTFTVDELEALVAGARMVQAWSDQDLKAAARSALLKVEAATPPDVRRRLRHSEIHAPDFWAAAGGARFMGEIRKAMRLRHKIAMHYRRGDGQASQRTMHPLGLFFWGHTWLVAAWCELRESFRTFRVDRIEALALQAESFEIPEGRTLADYLRHAESEYAHS